MIDITGLDPADVLRTLYNHSKPQGMGFLDFDPANMRIEEARTLLAENDRFDYLNGRVLKIKIENPINPRLYDRDNGEGSAACAIDLIRPVLIGAE